MAKRKVKKQTYKGTIVSAFNEYKVGDEYSTNHKGSFDHLISIKKIKENE